MAKKSTPMTKGDAARIQSGAAKSGKNAGFARRAQSAADRAAARGGAKGGGKK